MSWKWIVGPERAANALRFATKEECEAYGTNLAWRWLGMPEPSLAVECDDPVTEGNERAFKPAFHKVQL